MASRDKVGCPTAAATLPLDRLLASLAANAEQLGKRWEIAVRDRRARAAERRMEADTAPPVQLHTPLFYATCALGGVLSTGLTHLAVTPLDLVKCNMQVSQTETGSLAAPVQASRSPNNTNVRRELLFAG